MIYSDYVVLLDLNKFGAYVVALNHDGCRIAACSEPLHRALELELVEALSLRRVVQLAKDEGFSNVMFASDCLLLV